MTTFIDSRDVQSAEQSTKKKAKKANSKLFLWSLKLHIICDLMHGKPHWTYLNGMLQKLTLQM